MDSSFNIWKLMKVDEAQRFWIWRWCINMLHASGSTVGKPNLKRKCATFFVQGDPLMEIGIREFCLIYLYIYYIYICISIMCISGAHNLLIGWSGTNPSRYRIVRRMPRARIRCNDCWNLAAQGCPTFVAAGILIGVCWLMMVDAYLINEFLPEHAFGV